MKSQQISPENEIKLNELRSRIKEILSEKRYAHTLFVEKTARALALDLMPERVYDICVAAILHDATKELPKTEHINIIESENEILTDEDKTTDGILHSFSAPLFCRKEFSKYVNNDILSAVKNHTVGSPSMSVFDKIIFISDFIEESRKYKSCIEIRNWLLAEFSRKKKYEDKIYCLNKACLLAILATEESLKQRGAAVNSRMLLTKDSLVRQLQN